MNYEQETPRGNRLPKHTEQSQRDRGAEMRSIERFTLGASAVLQVGRSPDKSDRRTVHAVCHDISSSGAFFVTGESVRVGAEIGARLPLDFKATVKSRTAGHRAVLEVDGTVIRKEERGIAVKFGKKYSLRPAQTEPERR